MARYALGHASAEQDRLQVQASYLRGMTESIWRAAGIQPGMRVMDVGCGVGDTTFLAADLVGPNGFVVGIDRSADAIASARQRSQAISRPNVQFVEGDLGSRIADQEPFDAVVGRYVLVHQPDIVAALWSLRDLVRPGGVIAFHEIELGTTHVTDPSSELVERVRFWLREAFRLGGVQLDAVSQMSRYFYEAGLGWPETSIHTTVSSGPDGFGPDWIVSTLRSLASLLEKGGVATASELGLDTLAARVRESCANGAASVVTVNGGVWVRRA
jgi:ubiquinone/menaquinone biosynthesis C-methylase UbiE